MSRGGYRKNAGRPKGAGASPSAQNSIRAKIKTNQIIKRLSGFVDGHYEMSGPAVTAALGLLRKVIPDLASVTHSGQVELKRAAELTDDELASIAASGGTRDSQSQDDTPIVH